jgi:hypothetical protein
MAVAKGAGGCLVCRLGSGGKMGFLMVKVLEIDDAGAKCRGCLDRRDA